MSGVRTAVALTAAAGSLLLAGCDRGSEPTARSATPAAVTAAATAENALAAPTRSPTASPAASASPEAAGIPITVLRDGSSALVLATVTLDGRPLTFLIDTGASRSLIETEVATAAHLPKTGAGVQVSGVAGGGAATQVHVQNWRLGTRELPPTDLVSTTLGISTSRPISGLLGSDVLSRFGRVTIDYRNSRAFLG